jgi:hypothetical protein
MIVAAVHFDLNHAVTLARHFNTVNAASWRSAAAAICSASAADCASQTARREIPQPTLGR